MRISCCSDRLTIMLRKKVYPYIIPMACSVFMVLCLSACRQGTNVPELDTADSLMEQRPDSALALLRRIDTLRLSAQHDRARYAMLLSMALDKNYIDLKDFHVLQPAIDYYEDHGTPTEQMRTFYYQGRIYENAGNMSKALQTFLKALERGKESNDILTKARTYSAQIHPYEQLMAFDKAIEAGKKAAYYFQKARKTNSNANCLIKIASTYTFKNDKANTWKYLKECRKLWPHISEKRKQEFYNNYLITAISFSGMDSIQAAIREYESHVPPSEWDILTLADAYAGIKNFKRAEYFATQHKLHSSSIYSDKRYYAILYFLYRAQGKYKEAGEAYTQFNNINDSLNISALQENVRLTEARHQLELLNREAELTRVRNYWMAACCITILLLVVLFISYRLRISRMQKRLAEQEKEHYRRQYEQLEEEFQSLQSLLAGNNRLNSETKEIIKSRLALLNEFFKAYITEDGREPEKHITRILEDKEAFMQSTRKAFTVSHPEFVRYLEEQGLTPWEVGYCCLFALGLNSKEVGRYINSCNYNKTNTHIRKKLGLDNHSTNLNLYILQLLQNNDQQTEVHTQP